MEPGEGVVDGMKKSNYPKAVSFSKSQINRYGDILRYPVYVGRVGDNDSAFVDAYDEAFNGVSAWRAAHLYPLNTLRTTLTRRVNLLSSHPVVAQRLKRMPTIISETAAQPRDGTFSYAGYWWSEGDCWKFERGL